MLEQFSETPIPGAKPVVVSRGVMKAREIAVKHDALTCAPSNATTVTIKGSLVSGAIFIVAECDRCGPCAIIDADSP